jgi:hypothetical protein
LNLVGVKSLGRNPPAVRREAPAERFGQLLLAHSEHQTPHAKPVADVLVDGIWLLKPDLRILKRFTV